MKILIVSGFLGAGKTTFIKELIRRSGTHPVILENEYGENNLDSRELGSLGGMKILEFMEGCVCCTKKDSFANTILTISAGLDPEYLIVEPTGVGKLSSILQNIRALSYDRIRLLRSVVVLSPRSFAQNRREWPEIYTDQIVNADIVVFSKVEHAPPEQPERIAREIKALNPQAEVIQTHYSAQPASWWTGLLETEGDSAGEKTSGAAQEHISQLSLHHAALANPGELVVLLEDILRGEFGRIPRAKGTLKAGPEMLRFDLADGLYAVSGAAADAETQCVFIGAPIAERALRKRLHTSPAENKTPPAGWDAKELFLRARPRGAGRI